MSHITTTISGITKKGYSYAELNGKRIQIPYGCPEDEVIIEKLRRRKGRIETLITPSAHRIPVRCSHAGEVGDTRGKCGGCSFQYIDYQYQLELKRELIQVAFSRKGIDCAIAPVIASPKTFHYRNRMDFVVGANKQLGLREKGSWRFIVPLSECSLISESMLEVFLALKQWLATSTVSGWDSRKHEGYLRYIVLRETKNTGELAVIFITYQKDLDEYIDELRDILPDTVTHIYNGINDSDGDVSVVDEYQTYYGEDYMREEIDGVSYFISPGSFFQTNMFAAEKLLSLVKTWITECAPTKLMDLYCGSGFFALQMGGVVHEITGVELDERAIERANESLANHKHKDTISFESSDAIDYPLDGGYDTLLVDPPRSGLHPKVVQQIIRNNIPNIVYVSCNYVTLAENLETLKEYYDIVRIQPVDMFPHTPHIETVVQLRKK